jgi:hypothetical protein
MNGVSSVPCVAPLVLVPVGSDYLALTHDQFLAARALAQNLTHATAQPQPTTNDQEPMLTAEQMQDKTGVPASWFLEQARQGQIPHYKFVKYPRFRMSELALYAARRPAQDRP